MQGQKTLSLSYNMHLFLAYLLNDSQTIHSEIPFSKPLLCVMLICGDWSNWFNFNFIMPLICLFKQHLWVQCCFVYSVTGVTAIFTRRVWLQTALALSALALSAFALSALARSDTSASASDVNCSLFNFLFCSICWLFFVWISQHFTTVAGGEDKNK